MSRKPTAPSWNIAPDLATWVNVRRYAVPRWMIERCTEAREAGNWRGACDVSNVDIDFDLREVARRYGSGVADKLEDDVRHLAPDLMRWHLPRGIGGVTTLSPRRTFTLASYGRSPSRGPRLLVHTPGSAYDPQRLRLDVGDTPTSPTAAIWQHQWWTASRHLWHTGHTGELLARCGGGERAPFFTRDGRGRDAAELPTGPSPDDPVAHTEWLTMRYGATNGDADECVALFEAAGIALDPKPPKANHWNATRDQLTQWLVQQPIAVGRLAAETLALRTVAPRWVVPFSWSVFLLLDVSDPEEVRARMHGAPSQPRARSEPVKMLPESSWRRLPDLDLFHGGRITADELHPLVCRALFPDRAPARAPGPPPPAKPEVIRVRCGGEWHEVHATGGQLTLAHTDAEEQREKAITGLGGTTAGCFAVKRAWLTGASRLPRRLRAQRQDLFWRAQHGDTPGVVALLDAGMDPAVRDGQRRTLLHLLHQLNHEVLLPRLLAAGLDLEARDEYGRTPLHVAIADHGSVSLVRALIDAGAAIGRAGHKGQSIADLIDRSGRQDLGFLTRHSADRQPAGGGRSRGK